MPDWKKEIKRQVAGLKLAPTREAEIVEELSQHLEDRYQELLTTGTSSAAAERLTLAELSGNELLACELQRAERKTSPEPIVEGTTRKINVVADIRNDLRYAVRILLKRPGFTAIAVITLALGIGASTAIFSAVKPILFESLPYPDAGQIVTIWDDFGTLDSSIGVTFGNYYELVQRNRSFTDIAVVKPWRPAMIGGAEPERLEGQRVSASYFHVLSVSPAFGLNFNSADDRVNGPNSVIISERLWQRRFNGERAIVGRQVILDGKSFTVIGVMPRAFENVLAPKAEVWSLLQYDTSLPSGGREWGHHLRMVGRLKPGIGIDQARSELNTLARTPVPEFARPPHASLETGLLLSSLQDQVTRGVKPALLAVLGGVVLLLLIACVNVTNLLLARGANRRGEFAMRIALGAERGRMIRQLLTESLLLAMMGGLLGLPLAVFGARALVTLSPIELPRMVGVEVDGVVFAFTFGITTLVGLAVGLIPALHASRGELNLKLQQSSRRTVGGHQWMRRTLVIAEVSLTLVLLVAAGLLFRSLSRLFAIDPGFDTSQLITMQVLASGTQFDDEKTHRFFDQSLAAVRQLPGVSAAAFSSQLPLSGDLDDGYGVHFESSGTDNTGDRGAFRYAVSPSYLETMAIPLRRGRLLNAGDTANAPPVVLISESLARGKFQDQEPIGQRLRLGANDGPWSTIVGVVGDVKQTSLTTEQMNAVYMTNEQWRIFADRALWLIVRARGDATALTPAIRQAIWSIDKDQPIVRVNTMDRRLASSSAERNFALTLFEVFGLVALVLVAIGLYGVLSASVTERTREIGVRLALGAQKRNVLYLILRQGLTLTLAGVSIGLLASWAVTRLLSNLLYGVSATDPVVFGSVTVLLMAVAFLACYVPARRAMKVDPLVVLRYE